MKDLEQAFETVRRKDFLPHDMEEKAEEDAPLPIGFGQTNSQPTTVRHMLSWLAPDEGDHVLDVGSGSGWTTALLAYLVGTSGKVYAVEKIPELVDIGRENCYEAGYDDRVRFFHAGDTYGLPDFAPYDRILVSASADELPVELVAQLKVGGVMVVPVFDSVCVVKKLDDDNHFESTKHEGYSFVPLIK